MLVLIDESGCPGFKLEKGSSPYFVIAMVVFQQFKDAEDTNSAIENLKNTFSIRYEIKFSKTHPDIRDIFFNTIEKYNFMIHALYVEKKSIKKEDLINNTNNFYNYFIRKLLHDNNNLLSNAVIKIDGSGDKGFKRGLTSYLRKEYGINKISKLKFVDSKKDNLIQLADMVVGAISRSYNLEKKDSSRWLKVLTKKIGNLIELR